MISYVKYQCKTEIGGNLWYLRPKQTETIDIEGLADHMSTHNSMFTEGVIKGLLCDMVNCVRELLMDGKKVKLDDLVLMSIGVKCKGEANPADLSASNIQSVKLRCQGVGKMDSANRKLIARFKEADYYTGATDEGLDNPSQNL